MHYCGIAVALVILAATPPTDRPAAPRPAAPVSPLKQAVDGLWKEAAIATDAEYQKLFGQAGVNASATRDMRQVVASWPQPRNLRGWPQQMSVSFQDERVTLSWGGEIACGDEAEAANRRFAAALTKQGYRLLNDEELKAFQKNLEPSWTRRREVFRRASGEADLLASFEAQSYTGSSTYLSGVRFHWFARRPYRGAQPTLAEALAVLPDWMKVKFLSEKFYSALADEPISGLDAGRDFKVSFVRPVTTRLIAALEKSGFEYRNESSPQRDGGTQKTWYRFSDVTYAHVMESADGKTVRFYCQPPQHQGDPIAVKPPPLHPSLRLPREKRPILTFDQLTFADGELQRQTKLFQDLAEKLAQKDWQVQLYKDGRYSAQPFFTAYWQTSLVPATNYIPKVRPYQGVFISLQGRQSDGSDELNSLHVGGAMAPANGWGARVMYDMYLSPEGTRRASLAAVVGLARESNVLSLDASGGGSATSLTQRWVTASANESNSFRYRFQAQTSEPTLERSLRMLYGTPETLRDEMLADIDALRQQAREQLEKGTAIVFYDMTNVRSDNPPRQAPADTRPPNDKTKRALADAVEQQLAAQEAIIREHFGEIHAAVQQALPLKPLLDKLSTP